MEIEGPAVQDVALHFAERWNDPEGRLRTHPRIPDSISTDFKSRPPAPVGTHSLQLLRTYAVLKLGGFTWSNRGEFTIWVAYLAFVVVSVLGVLYLGLMPGQVLGLARGLAAVLI